MTRIVDVAPAKAAAGALGALSFGLLLAAAAAGVPARAGERFSIAGMARLDAAAPVQKNARFELNATLSARQSAAALPDERYAIDAVAAAQSLVCYDDTIFRDDFDADGL